MPFFHLVRAHVWMDGCYRFFFEIERNDRVLLYKKAQMSGHRENYISRDINSFVKMSIIYSLIYWIVTFSLINIRP